MQGYIARRGSRWAAKIFEGRDDAGKKRYRWLGTYDTKREADAEVTKKLAEMHDGTYTPKTKETVGQFLMRWMRDHAKPKLAPRAYEGYESVVRLHLLPAFGDTPLDKLTPSALAKYYREKLESGNVRRPGQPLSATTVHRHHEILHAALATAVKWDLLSRNPADRVDPPSVDSPEIGVMDGDEALDVLEHVDGTEWHPIFTLAVYGAMRRSELLALTWGNVDLVNAYVTVNRALHQLRDGSIIIRETKSKKSRRRISLPLEAVKVLEKHKAASTRTGNDDLVFQRPDGQPMSPNAVSHAWDRAAKKVGIAVSLHGARHTHASLLIAEGVPLKVIQERLGHASISVTGDIYAHLLPGLDEAAAASFGNALAVATERRVAKSSKTRHNAA